MRRSIPRLVSALALFALGFVSARLLPSESAAQGPKEKPMASALVRAADAVPTRGPWGEWRRYFRGDTYGTKDMVILAVHLKSGEAPHPPHQHAEEEFMILADGVGTWTLGDKEFAAKKGDVVYASPWTMHGLKNTDQGTLTYYMVKWNNRGVPIPAKPDEKMK
jgi:mannose-6-phosphate isomerase-like protein (cupin superfamily)